MDFGDKTMNEAVALPAEVGGEDDARPVALQLIKSDKADRFSAADIYITEPTWRDKVAVARLAEVDTFFFAPFNNVIDVRTATPDEIAERLVYGAPNETVRAVRLRENDETIGIVRFEHKKLEKLEGKDAEERQQFRRPTEISYFLHPKYHGRGVSVEAVLRALDWCIASKGLGQNRNDIIIATVDPNNLPSHQILKRIGLRTIDLVESHYADPYGDNRPRLLMEGNVSKHVIPALQRAKDNGGYIPQVEAARLIERGFADGSVEATQGKLRQKGLRASAHPHHGKRTGNAVEAAPAIQVAASGNMAGEYGCYRPPLQTNLPYLQNLNWGPRRS